MTRSVWLSSNLIFVADTPVVMRKPTSCKHFVTLSFMSYRYVSRCIFCTLVVYWRSHNRAGNFSPKTRNNLVLRSFAIFFIVESMKFVTGCNGFILIFGFFEFPVPQFIYMLIVFPQDYKSCTSLKIFENQLLQINHNTIGAK